MLKGVEHLTCLVPIRGGLLKKADKLDTRKILIFEYRFWTELCLLPLHNIWYHIFIHYIVYITYIHIVIQIFLQKCLKGKTQSQKCYNSSLLSCDSRFFQSFLLALELFPWEKCLDWCSLEPQEGRNDQSCVFFLGFGVGGYWKGVVHGTAEDPHQAHNFRCFGQIYSRLLVLGSPV